MSRVAGSSDERAHAEVAALRPLLFAIAYRMLSSVADAEDVVQESFLRYHRAVQEKVAVESPKAYLSAVATRLAIDHLRSARHRREVYVGEWLPEPLIESPDDPERQAETADSLSMAFLLLLERLGAVERAVFLLHDVFDFGYEAIAAIVGKSVANCRQLAARARRRVEAGGQRFEASSEQHAQLADRFFAAMRSGDVEGLVRVLAADARVYGDGGGKVPQWARPIVGADAAARLMAGLGRQLVALEVAIDRRLVNGQPGAIFRDRRGAVINVFALDIADGSIRAIRSVINPDKLQHLGPVADVRALQEELRSR